MTSDELVTWLFARTAGGIRWGLERTNEMLADVGNPHRLFHSILIAGTNGKGSVAAICDSVLRQEGSRKIGLYTSPHLIDFRERMRIDGRMIEPDELTSAAIRLLPSIERTGATFFEATTAIAFLAFAEAGVEVAVVEVGLGGRLDATNVLEPLVTAITNIGRDHTDYLGEELSEIAREKAGILRSGVSVISGVTQPELRSVIREQAQKVGAELHEIGEGNSRPGSTPGSSRLSTREWGEVELQLPLDGPHQSRNLAVALEILGHLPEELRPSRSAVVEGVASVRWPGRLQRVALRGTTWMFDVAHNQAGAEALVSAIPSLDLPRPWVFVVGILGDKDWKKMLDSVLPLADASILTVPSSAPSGRKWDVQAAAETQATLERPPRVIPDLEAALQRAETMAPHGTVIVTGSVHTVGDAMKFLGIEVA